MQHGGHSVLTTVCFAQPTLGSHIPSLLLYAVSKKQVIKPISYSTGKDYTGVMSSRIWFHCVHL